MGVALACPTAAYANENRNIFEELFFGSDFSHRAHDETTGQQSSDPFTPRRMPTLKPGDAVILDNLGSHKGKAVRRAICTVGARLVFLPKYSPDLNQVFAKFKTLLRKAAARSYYPKPAQNPRSAPARQMRRMPQEGRIRDDPKSGRSKVSSGAERCRPRRIASNL